MQKRSRKSTEYGRSAQGCEDLSLQLDSVMESISEGVLIADQQGNVLTANKAALALLGFDDLEQVRRSLPEFEAMFQVFDMDGRPVDLQERPLMRAVRGERFVGYELQVRRSGSGTSWIGSFSGTPLYGEDGDTKLTVVTGRDITESREMQEDLRRAKEQLQLITSTMSIGVVQCSLERRFIWVSPAYAAWVQQKPEELVGHTLAEALGEEAYQQVSPLIDRVMKGERIEYELPLNFPRLGVRWVLGKYMPTFDHAGEPNGWVAVVLDITDRKKMEEELQQSKEFLEQRVAERTAELSSTVATLQAETQQRLQAEKELRDKEQMLIHQSRMAAMGEMIGNIAHQWRQPLNMLGLLAQDLELTYKMGEFSAEYLERGVRRMLGAIQHMSKTIDDFRDFFKPEKQKADFRIQEVILRALSILEASLIAEHIEVSLIPASDPVAKGYPSEFAQVIINIVANARDELVKRQVVSPSIRIEVGTEEGRGIVTISDNAGGIPDDIIDKIFDPYFTTKGPEQGTGLGLYMSKIIIERSMKGSLSARNVKEGAEFQIVL
jgi:two-component system C4-dicarboxylate transport sensor histidine kinase DctB